MGDYSGDSGCCGRGHHEHARKDQVIGKQRVREALREAEQVCREKGVRLTDIRRRVLELIWERKEPVGAYSLLQELGRDGHAAAPPTVYRALDFLLEQGLVHRLEKLNAFVTCSRPETPHVSQFFICSECRSVTELSDSAIENAIREKAQREGFAIRRQIIEVEGVCRPCQEKSR